MSVCADVYSIKPAHPSLLWEVAMFSLSRRQRVRLGPRWPDLKQDQHLDHNRSQGKLSVCSSALESVRPYFFIWENWLLATIFLSSYQTEVSTSRSTLTVPWNNRSLFYYQKGAAHNSDFLFHHKVIHRQHLHHIYSPWGNKMDLIFPWR